MHSTTKPTSVEEGSCQQSKLARRCCDVDSYDDRHLTALEYFDGLTIPEDADSARFEHQ